MPDDAGLHRLVSRLEAAIAKAAVEVASSAEAALRCAASDADGDDSPALHVQEATHEATESSHAARRRKAAAGHAQTRALSRVITSCSLAGCGRHEAAGRQPLWSVEFGAGSGSLSKRLASDALALGARPLSGQVMLDRSCARGGAKRACVPGEDRWEEHDPRMLGSRTLRLRIDIRHLYLPGLDELRAASVVGVGKHVCGVATDLMLRSLVEPQGRRGLTRNAEGDGEGAFSCELIGVALCCHHLCTFEDYVHRPFLDQAGIGADEFALVCRLSGWATGCRGANGDAFRRHVGATCKAFLDAGRCVYLRARGFRAELLEYCSPDQSPENRMLLARCTAGVE
jgi:tRNA:m4X modification enzyme